MRFKQIEASTSVWGSCARTMILLGLFALPGLAQTPANLDPVEPQQGQPLPTLLPRPGGEVSRQSVDEKAMQALIHELVGCGTRHSLSSWTDSKRGIGCARDLVTARFRKFSAESGGKLQVIVDKFEATSERTGAKPSPMENVYAILPGSDPKLAKTL